MRRPTKRLGKVKMLTASLAAAALVSGSFSVYASQGYGYINFGGRDFSIEFLRNNPDYLDAFIESFNTGGRIYYQPDADGEWAEISQTITRDDDGNISIIPGEDDDDRWFEEDARNLYGD